MRIKILTNSNCFIDNSAMSNRNLSLIAGLKNQGVLIDLIITGPYRNEAEKTKWGIQGEKFGVSYFYSYPKVISGYWQLRFQNYIGQYLFQKQIKKGIFVNLEESSFVWLSGTIFSLELAISIKNRFPRIKFFLEQSEFLDVHRFNKGNFLQKREGDRRQELFEREVFPILDGLALMTKTLFSHYKSFPEPQPNMLHLPMTVDLERFNQIAPAPIEFQKPYIAFVGVMNDAKDGVNILLESFAELAEEFSDYKLYLVGGWNYDTPAHLNFIKERRLENHIFWMKEYPRDRIPAIIGNADLLVLPRPDSKQAQGGFPTKLGEYLATGNPICATSVGEIPDYLNDNESVFFAQPGSFESFAEAMRRALSDPENAKRVGLNGKKVAQMEFNKDIQAKKLHQFLLELQANKR